MQISGDRIFICIQVIVDSIKVMFFCISHQVKLILNFKGWSTDPIILDYCIMLFALIFVVLGFYYSTGFLFDLGKPRLTLLFTLCACLFSAVAVVDGLLDGSFATILEYLGFIAWLLPVVCAVSVPSAPDALKTEDETSSN